MIDNCTFISLFQVNDFPINSVEELKLINYTENKNDYFQIKLKDFHNVKQIELINCQLSDTNFTSLSNKKYFNHLTTLFIVNTKIPAKTTFKLQNLQTLKIKKLLTQDIKTNKKSFNTVKRFKFS
ncbi:hypothetical protein [Mycoplasma sp. 3686d]|uniref:hypothetical protein n=1 Tax=Mycoplasma sp. 3686d TaxID=2967300 RepID=UPI00211C86B8|nr:hypothetical protein [Mycoplasma sp. 3686d]UUM24540.1 hypothetical protein NPA12_02460 [Mycoplasma sp. 3686d]